MSMQNPPAAQPSAPLSAPTLHELDIPPADNHPGLGLFWPEEAQQAADSGHRDAQHWLERNKGHLWTQLVDGRARLESPMQRAAYELGFVMRLEQRLREGKQR